MTVSKPVLSLPKGACLGRACRFQPAPPGMVPPGMVPPGMVPPGMVPSCCGSHRGTLPRAGRETGNDLKFRVISHPIEESPFPLEGGRTGWGCPSYLGFSVLPCGGDRSRLVPLPLLEVRGTSVHLDRRPRSER